MSWRQVNIDAKRVLDEAPGETTAFARRCLAARAFCGRRARCPDGCRGRGRRRAGEDEYAVRGRGRAAPGAYRGAKLALVPDLASRTLIILSLGLASGLFLCPPWSASAGTGACCPASRRRRAAHTAPPPAVGNSDDDERHNGAGSAGGLARHTPAVAAPTFRPRPAHAKPSPHGRPRVRRDIRVTSGACIQSAIPSSHQP